MYLIPKDAQHLYAIGFLYGSGVSIKQNCEDDAAVKVKKDSGPTQKIVDTMLPQSSFWITIHFPYDAGQ